MKMVSKKSIAIYNDLIREAKENIKFFGDDINMENSYFPGETRAVIADMIRYQDSYWRTMQHNHKLGIISNEKYDLSVKAFGIVGRYLEKRKAVLKDVYGR